MEEGSIWVVRPGYQTAALQNWIWLIDSFFIKHDISGLIKKVLTKISDVTFSFLPYDELTLSW